VTATSPSLRLERHLLRAGATCVAGIDEVGRGALSGPVSVGVVVVDARRRALAGVRDSKLLQPSVREDLAPRIRAWAVCHAVGHAGPGEIDAIGIIAALRLAAMRALGSLSTPPDAVILDGRHDWLTPPAQASLLDGDLPHELVSDSCPPVTTQVKADLTCTSVAAASILAKVERDALMAGLHEQDPRYGWRENKGYASPDHVDALRRWGPSDHHRRSWDLPG